MTTYFISRHQGAKLWAEIEGFHVDQQLEHFEVQWVQVGDVVLGTLPINLVAEINERGGRYYHLILDLPPNLRGLELSAESMRQYGARLTEYSAKKISPLQRN